MTVTGSTNLAIDPGDFLGIEQVLSGEEIAVRHTFGTAEVCYEADVARHVAIDEVPVLGGCDKDHPVERIQVTCVAGGHHPRLTIERGPAPRPPDDVQGNRHDDIGHVNRPGA
jgi:hypothetical protein